MTEMNALALTDVSATSATKFLNAVLGPALDKDGVNIEYVWCKAADSFCVQIAYSWKGEREETHLHTAFDVLSFLFSVLFVSDRKTAIHCLSQMIDLVAETALRELLKDARIDSDRMATGNEKDRPAMHHNPNRTN